ncbi:nitrilase-related carbon-nitrogen hydrolase [Butyrivibrio sp. X503]|uniref:nitrilase-related carbon-nitrogen hydrolase n=1 Tax=Butyrivibrio sp. X503 TaxID=2364878 RepID=UPI0026A3B349
MSLTKVACIQYACGAPCASDKEQVENSIKKAAELAKKAADNGAKIILLSELFERKYFCQERRYDYYELAVPILDNPAVKYFSEFCKENKVVMPISVFEKDENVFYNSVAMIDADGKIVGVYRKTHIPDDHYYQEKFYFTPGNTGFKVFKTFAGNIGVGICWDQWFPETARCLALGGADIILYPTAIGSEPILDVDSSGHWMRTMQGHSAANIIPVAAANRIGKEDVEPCEENGGQKSSLCFYGSSFLTDQTGDVIAKASRDKEEIIYAEYDFEEIKKMRSSWGLFRDRRPSCYGDLVK